MADFLLSPVWWLILAAEVTGGLLAAGSLLALLPLGGAAWLVYSTTRRLT